jgi:NADPH-dependent 2,4-dienoyl-CoA reductase/sulfur reductase-like enzyme
VAAQRLSFALRNLGFDGSIVVLGKEEVAPYDRTALSKRALTDGSEPTPLRLADAYREHEIALRLGRAATAVDIGRKQVVCGHEREPYDSLVICTGARAAVPRQLERSGVLTLREQADLARLHNALEPGRRLTVIGGGFIGGEVASSAAHIGLDVVMVEADPAPLHRIVGEEMAKRVKTLHVEHGIDVRCGQSAASVDQAHGALIVRLADESVIESDSVLLAVGMQPNVEWLADSPLQVGRGVLTDELGETNVSDVWAAGDCAETFSPRYRRHIVAEHWDFAGRTGERVAAAMLGEAPTPPPVPFFWSDQHEVRLNWAGPAREPDDQVAVTHLADGGVTAEYHRHGTLRAVFGINATKQIAQTWRQLSNQPLEHCL